MEWRENLYTYILVVITNTYSQQQQAYAGIIYEIQQNTIISAGSHRL